MIFGNIFSLNWTSISRWINLCMESSCMAFVWQWNDQFLKVWTSCGEPHPCLEKDSCPSRALFAVSEGAESSCAVIPNHMYSHNGLLMVLVALWVVVNAPRRGWKSMCQVSPGSAAFTREARGGGSGCTQDRLPWAAVCWAGTAQPFFCSSPRLCQGCWNWLGLLTDFGQELMTNAGKSSYCSRYSLSSEWLQEHLPLPLRALSQPSISFYILSPYGFLSHIKIDLSIQASHPTDVKAHDTPMIWLFKKPSPNPIASLPYSHPPLRSHCHQWKWWGLTVVWLWGIRAPLDPFASIPKPHSAYISNINSLVLQKVEPMP